MRMMHPRRRLTARSLLPLLVLGLVVALGAFAAGKTPRTGAAPAHPKPTPALVSASPGALRRLPPPSAAWTRVDALVAEQKMQAALDLATKLRAAAQARQNGAEWARGLIRE